MTWKTQRRLYFLTPFLWLPSLLCLMILVRNDMVAACVWFGLVITFYMVVPELKGRQTKLLEHVRFQFSELGYTLLGERLLRITEWPISVGPSAYVTGRISNEWWQTKWKYRKVYCRIFKAEGADGKIWELRTVVSRKWDDTYEIQINGVRRFLTQA